MLKIKGFLVAAAMLAGLLACGSDKPFPVDNANLGIKAVFPGEARLSKYVEDTPYGQMEWFNTAYFSSGNMDMSCHIDVGNLPRGTQGGTTPQAILETFEKWMGKRFEGFTRSELSSGSGPGFRYQAKAPSGNTVEGIVIFRRGRLHHAQASSGKAKDPRVGAFLESFEVQK